MAPILWCVLLPPLPPVPSLDLESGELAGRRVTVATHGSPSVTRGDPQEYTVAQRFTASARRARRRLDLFSGLTHPGWLKSSKEMSQDR